jgi:hypothetical protein
MATTKNKLAEQIIRIVEGGNSNRASDIDSREVILFIEQERDALVYREFLGNKNMNEHDIHGDWITTVRGLPITKSNIDLTNIDDNGDITVASHSVKVGDYVRIAGTSNFNGYFKVTATANTTITTDRATDGSATETSGKVIASYDDNVSLPYMPLSLPGDSGIFAVYPDDDTDDYYLTLGAGGKSLYSNLIAKMDSSQSHRQGRYKLDGSKIYIDQHSNLNSAPSVLNVEMVASAKDIGDDEVFPIPAQYEADIIRSSVQLYLAMQQLQDDEINDSIN